METRSRNLHRFKTNGVQINDQEIQKIADSIVLNHDKIYEIKGMATLSRQIEAGLKQVRDAQEENLKIAREAFRSQLSIPYYAYGDNEVAVTMAREAEEALSKNRRRGMKSYLEWAKETDEERKMFGMTGHKIYLAGADEKLKSIRCNSCKRHLTCPIETMVFMGCDNGSISDYEYDNFGCNFHEQKGE